MADERDDEKWNAYHDTVIEVADDAASGSGLLRVDLRRPDLPALADRLRALGLEPPVAILTAENPYGANAEESPGDGAEERARTRNDHRHDTLLAELREAGLPHARVDGVAPDGCYRERCVAVPLPAEAARALARRLRQLAFFWFDGERMWLEPALADRAREPLAGE